MDSMRIFKWVKQIIGSIVLMFIIYLPGEPGVLLRRRYYSKRLRRCGNNLYIGTNVHITGYSLIEMGDNVKIRENVIINTGSPKADNEKRDVIDLSSGDNFPKGLVIIGNHADIAFGALILGYGGVRLGEKCGIGPGAIVLSESFHYKGQDISKVYKYTTGALPEEQCVMQGCVEFKDGAVVASNVIVLPGTVIGKDAWVGPNSVTRVKGSIPDDSVARGDPAVVVLERPYKKRLRPLNGRELVND